MSLITDEFGDWLQLGTVTPDFPDWIRYPVLGNSYSGVLRITYLFPRITEARFLRSWAYFRAGYQIGDLPEQVQRATRLYPKQAIQLIDYPAPLECLARGLSSRYFEVRKAIRPRLGIVPDQFWQIKIEELAASEVPSNGSGGGNNSNLQLAIGRLEAKVDALATPIDLIKADVDLIQQEVEQIADENYTGGPDIEGGEY